MNFGFSCRFIGVLACLLTLISATAAHADDAAKPRLVIVKAVYGDLPDGDKTDVTAKVSAMVKDDTLTVAATNDNFDDPAVGVSKKLQVDYTIDGKAGSKSVGEDETLYVTAKPANLVIIKAVYGDLPDGDKTDVTAKVTAMIKDDTLSVAASNDNFDDPAVGTAKKLKVDYVLNGKPGSRTVDEDQTFFITAKPSKIVITKAEYGDLPDGAKSDVTAKVTEKIVGNTLSVEASNDIFGDPAEGVGKKLKVDYTFDGKAKTKTVDEGDTLTISDTGD